jgi:hypothetical protein
MKPFPRGVFVTVAELSATLYTPATPGTGERLMGLFPKLGMAPAQVAKTMESAAKTIHLRPHADITNLL